MVCLGIPYKKFCFIVKKILIAEVRQAQTMGIDQLPGNDTSYQWQIVVLGRFVEAASGRSGQFDAAGWQMVSSMQQMDKAVSLKQLVHDRAAVRSS